MSEPRHPPRFLPAAAIALVLCLAAAAAAMDQVTFRPREGFERLVEGRVELTAQDHGIMLLARDGEIWLIPPEEQVKTAHNDAPFRPFSPAEMSKELRDQLPKGFDVHATTHYLICHNTSRAYAQWCGALFERLYKAFHSFWAHKGFELRDPQFPLVAVVFADKPSYVKYSRAELGKSADAIIGYFSLASNRMTMYDQTGTQGAGRGNRLSTSAQINQVLTAPDAVRNVATVVHEATHQIAFNCGLHVRFSDCPLWFSEGVAVFCETPDLRSAKGWSGIGAVNPMRVPQFQRYLRNRPRDSLRTLISEDKRFHDLPQVLDAYSEAWALTYFLIGHHPKEYVNYLRMLSGKRPLMMDSPQVRIKEFEQHFGDLQQLDGEFIRTMSKLR